MGRARILSHAGEGRYIVEFDYGTELQTKALDRIDKLLADIAPRITEAEEAVAQAEAAKAQAVEALNTSIDAYVAAMGADPVDEAAAAALRETVDARSVETLEASLNLSERETVLALVKFEQVQLQTRRARTAAVTVTESRSVWCADYSLDLTGTVPTCEVVGEQGEIVIHPAALRSAPWSMQIDGFLLSRELMSPEQAFFNAAILPGWQRFKPIHRIGIITSLNLAADTASVVLDPATSSAAALPITPPGTLQNVPVQYMDCGASAFENGDRVIVKMRQTDGTAEAIIGFAANPKQCAASGFIVTGTGGATLVYRDEETNTWDKIPFSAVPSGPGWWHGPTPESTIRWDGTRVYRKRSRIGSVADSYPGTIVAAAANGDVLYVVKTERTEYHIVTVTYLEIGINANVVQFVSQEQFTTGRTSWSLAPDQVLPYFQFPQNIAAGSVAMSYSTVGARIWPPEYSFYHPWAELEVSWSSGTGLTINGEQYPRGLPPGSHSWLLFNVGGVEVRATFVVAISGNQAAGSATALLSIPFFGIADMEIIGTTYNHEFWSEDNSWALNENWLNKRLYLRVDPSNTEIAFLTVESRCPAALSNVEALTSTHSDVPTVSRPRQQGSDEVLYSYDSHYYRNDYFLRADAVPTEILDARETVITPTPWLPSPPPQASETIAVGDAFKAPIYSKRIPKSFSGDTCVSFDFQDDSINLYTGVEFAYLTDGDLPELLGPRSNYRPLGVI